MASRARKLDKSVHSAGQTAFCELMVKARKSAGLTQHELAKRLHKPQSFVAKYEGGERRVDVVEFIEICKAVEPEPHKLLNGGHSRHFGPNLHRVEIAGNETPIPGHELT